MINFWFFWRKMNVSLYHKWLHTRQTVGTLHTLQIVGWLSGVFFQDPLGLNFSLFLNLNFDFWCLAWLELPFFGGDHLDHQIPGHHYLETLSQLLCLFFPSRASVHLNKDIPIRKIPHSVAPPAPKLNKVTLCWTLCWLSLFIYIMSSILKRPDSPHTEQWRKLYSAKRWNRDPYKVQFSERSNNYVSALYVWMADHC